MFRQFRRQELIQPHPLLLLLHRIIIALFLFFHRCPSLSFLSCLSFSPTGGKYRHLFSFRPATLAGRRYFSLLSFLGKIRSKSASLYKKRIRRINTTEAVVT